MYLKWNYFGDVLYWLELQTRYLKGFGHIYNTTSNEIF